MNTIPSPDASSRNRRSIALTCALLLLAAAGPARAAVIASDSVLVGGADTYKAGHLEGQTVTAGTSGYFTGAPGSNPAPGWCSGTGAFIASAGGLSHPLVVNAPAANDGKITFVGNANSRIQYRDFASKAPPVSKDYYFSVLLQESANTYTGATYVGLSAALLATGNMQTPATGFEVGFVNGALALFYNSGRGSFTTLPLVPSPAPSATYLAVVHLDTAAGKLIPMVYDSTGKLVNNPAAQTVFATVNPNTDLGGFYLSMSSDFTNAITPAIVAYDELRFGTELGDVMVAPKSAAAAGNDPRQQPGSAAPAATPFGGRMATPVKIR